MDDGQEENSPILGWQSAQTEKTNEAVLPTFTVTDARKAARHCRETALAYLQLGTNADLDMLREESIKMKGHRRVFCTTSNSLIIKSGVELSTQQKLYARRTEVMRKNKEKDLRDQIRFANQQAAKKRRIALNNRSQDKKLKDSIKIELERKHLWMVGHNATR